MPTDRTMGGLDQGGFTLIEVLVAMLILAVGLLGLEALGIGAARSLAAAENKSEIVAMGTGAMERAQRTLRQGLTASPPSAVTGNSCTAESESRSVCTDVQTRNTDASLPVGNARITVTVTVGAAPQPSLSLTSYVFHPALP